LLLRQRRCSAMGEGGPTLFLRQRPTARAVVLPPVRSNSPDAASVLAAELGLGPSVDYPPVPTDLVGDGALRAGDAGRTAPQPSFLLRSQSFQGAALPSSPARSGPVAWPELPSTPALQQGRRADAPPPPGSPGRVPQRTTWYRWSGEPDRHAPHHVRVLNQVGGSVDRATWARDPTQWPSGAAGDSRRLAPMPNGLMSSSLTTFPRFNPEPIPLQLPVESQQSPLASIASLEEMSDSTPIAQPIV